MSVSVITCPWCKDTHRRLIQHLGTGELHGMPCACLHTDLPVPFFYQPEANGCGVAAVAMATRQPYERVRKLVSNKLDLSGHVHGEGVDVAALDDLLMEFGYALQRRSKFFYRLNRDREEWPCAPWADMHVAFVRNLSDTGDHYVAMLGDGRVLDPWWGVVNGLHRYPMVHSITALFPVTTRATLTTEPTP